MNTTTEYFLGDALGSVRQLTNASGAITYTKAYDPYGTVTTADGASQSAFGYTGEQQDASGLTYLRSHYYSSGMGRFLSRDTWIGDYNRPLSLNRWMYVSGNPINYTDPSGLTPCSETQTDQVRYCVLDNGGYIDVVHFKAKKEQARKLIDKDLPSQFGKTFGQIPFK